MAKVKAHLSRKKFKFWLSEKYNIDLSFTIHNYKHWFEFLQYIVVTVIWVFTIHSYKHWFEFSQNIVVTLIRFFTIHSSALTYVVCNKRFRTLLYVMPCHHIFNLILNKCHAMRPANWRAFESQNWWAWLCCWVASSEVTKLSF
jgi:hypothetical protein